MNMSPAAPDTIAFLRKLRYNWVKSAKTGGITMKRILSCLLIIVLCLGLIPTAAQPAEETSITKEALLAALYEADIASLRQAIDLGLISCEALTSYYLERIEAYNAPYKCFITLCDDALEIARQRDAAIADGTAEGTLFGIPIVIKDNINLAGYPTTNGHKKDDSQIVDTNARIVEYLLAEGAVIIGKTNMSTDAQSGRDTISQAVGQTKNAYSLSMSAAGSSGGSAVATSLNFAAAAIGTDTNSSLRLPAAFAGCVSLRGTHGLISNSGVTKLNGTRDIPGAITRNVYDQAILLDALTGGVYGYTENLNGNALQGLRIGVLKELAYPVSGQSGRGQSVWDGEVAAAFELALQQLRDCGAEVVTVSMPKIFSLSSATMTDHSAEKKAALYAAFEAMLTEYDVAAVVFPSYVTAPLRAGRDAEGKYWDVWEQTFTANCTILSPSASLPEITLPMGLHSLGCGMGLEIATRKNGEQLLLDIAYTYTNAGNHRILPEAAPNTYAEFFDGTLPALIARHLQQVPPTTEPTPPETTLPTIPETTAPTVPETEPIAPPTTAPVPPTTQPLPPETTRPAPPETTVLPPATAPQPTDPQPKPASAVLTPIAVTAAIAAWIVVFWLLFRRKK